MSSLPVGLASPGCWGIMQYSLSKCVQKQCIGAALCAGGQQPSVMYRTLASAALGRCDGKECVGLDVAFSVSGELYRLQFNSLA